MERNICVDVSVLAKWFASEEGREVAAALRHHLSAGAVLSLPGSWVLELGSAFYHKALEGTADLEAAGDWLEEAASMPMEVVPLEELVQPAIRLAVEYRITVWDAVHLVVALDRDADFFTADNRLYGRVRSLPKVHLVSW